MITARPQTVRHLNRAAVLDLIRQHQPLSRADLARLTGIHRSNISLIVEALQADGLLREERATDVARGRKPHLLSLDRGHVRVLGINLRPALTTIALAAMDGHIESSFTFETPPTPARFLTALDQAFRTVVEQMDLVARKPAPDIHNVVLSVPGIVTRAIGKPAVVWTPSLPQYSGCDLAGMVERQLKLPTVVSNNASLGAMSALRSLERGEEHRLSDFVFMVLGEVGVGAGVVIQRNLYSGYDAAYAGEVGHTVIDPKGPPCSCGRRGCLQLYICDSATYKRFNPRGEFTADRFQEMLDKADAVDAKACAAIRHTAEYLSLGISNIALTLNPERIVLAGAITRIWPLLEKELRSAFFLPDHHALIQPIQVPLDLLFLRGAVERGVDQVLAEMNRSGEPAIPVLIAKP